MTKEDKELLLKDLCGRLPYGVKLDVDGDICTLLDIDTEEGDSINGETFHKVGFKAPDIFYNFCALSEVKPYLRSMSSMTEEEYDNLCNSCTWLWFKDDLRTVTHGDYKCYDWLNAHHFDYRGLITMGLALEAPADMYKTE